MENNEIEIDHCSSSLETPMREDAFNLSDTEKIDKIEGYFKEIMQTLGLDLTDDSLKDTPRRVAKMYVQETFAGLNPDNMPKVTLFNNNYGYQQMLVERNISLYSQCEHHFVPIIGKVHVGYIANDKVIGLSKIHRIVKHFARRPQVQERLTRQIAESIKSTLGIEHVAVVVDARHMCVESRGIEDVTSSTVTASLSGQFLKDVTRKEFLRYINM